MSNESPAAADLSQNASAAATCTPTPSWCLENNTHPNTANIKIYKQTIIIRPISEELELNTERHVAAKTVTVTLKILILTLHQIARSIHE